MPGLLTYLWINLFGVTPSTKKSIPEMAFITVLLWIPIVCFILFIYNIFALLSNLQYLKNLIDVDIPVLKKDWNYIDSLSDLVNASQNLSFLLFYTLLTIGVSYLLAQFIAKYLYKRMIDQINLVREQNKVAPLSLHSTVWDSLFLNPDGQIIEYKKMGESTSIAGCLIKVPRAQENNKAIVLEAIDHWTKIIEYYEIQIDNTYLDIENGTVIHIYNLQKAIEAEKLFNERFPEGIITS